MSTTMQEDENTVLIFLQEFFNENGYSPTLREIQYATSFSISKIKRLLLDLEEKGYIINHPKIARGITFVKKDIGNFVYVPILGPIVASEPLPIPDPHLSNIPNYILIPRKLFGEEFSPQNRERKFKVSVTHPLMIAKGYSSLFLVQIYTLLAETQAKQTVSREFGVQKVTKHVWDIEIGKGSKIRIKLFSQVLLFSDPIIKKIDNDLVEARFTVIPNDTCRPGIQYTVLSITDIDTQLEYQSVSFSIPVADYAFDHVSRPLLHKLTSVALGVGSLVMFVLTALEQIDKTLGVAAGTAAAVLTTSILAQFWSLFKQQKVNYTP